MQRECARTASRCDALLYGLGGAPIDCSQPSTAGALWACHTCASGVLNVDLWMSISEPRLPLPMRRTLRLCRCTST